MDGTACALYNLRLGKSAGLQNDEGRLQPRFSKGRLFNAIGLNCQHCCGGVPTTCESPNCSLYPFRFGRSRAIRERQAERLAEAS